MKVVFFCFVLLLCLLCSPRLDAQAYIVTEEQIKRLETILTEYKTSNERQKAELQELKTAAAALRTESTKSKESLAKEIQSTEILKKNWQAYEAEKSKEIAALEKENRELNKKIAFIRGFLVASSIIIIGLSIALFCLSWKNKLSRF